MFPGSSHPIPSHPPSELCHHKCKLWLVTVVCATVSWAAVVDAGCSWNNQAQNIRSQPMPRATSDWRSLIRLIDTTYVVYLH